MPSDELIDTAKWLHQQGIVPLPLHLPIDAENQGKVPKLADWPHYQVRPDDFRGDVNLGVLLGPRSKHLTDVDLDWSEAAEIADFLLPHSWSFGRRAQTNGARTRLTHIVYLCDGAKTLKRKAPLSMVAGDARKQTIIELRAEGCQTAFPPSILYPDDKLTYIAHPDFTDLRSIEPKLLAQHMDVIAGAALLARLWPDLEGSRHDCTLALAGACHHAGWPAREAGTPATPST